MNTVGRSFAIIFLLMTVSSPACAESMRTYMPVGLIIILIFIVRLAISSSKSDGPSPQGKSNALAVDPEPMPPGSRVLAHQGRTVIIRPTVEVCAKNLLAWRSFASVDEYLEAKPIEILRESMGPGAATRRASMQAGSDVAESALPEPMSWRPSTNCLCPADQQAILVRKTKSVGARVWGAYQSC